MPTRGPTTHCPTHTTTSPVTIQISDDEDLEQAARDSILTHGKHVAKLAAHEGEQEAEPGRG
jgi:hypothetical protein